ncbi:MAG: hypothetical protein SFY92_04990 [Verrucomicrobiae bacterium]|nr:hypothetical protein [Verrucomicrobiae bacterium]
MKKFTLYVALVACLSSLAVFAGDPGQKEKWKNSLYDGARGLKEKAACLEQEAQNASPENAQKLREMAANLRTLAEKKRNVAVAIEKGNQAAIAQADCEMKEFHQKVEKSKGEIYKIISEKNGKECPPTEKSMADREKYKAAKETAPIAAQAAAPTPSEPAPVEKTGDSWDGFRDEVSSAKK